MALALLVRTRLGLAGEVHAHRAMALSRRLHERVPACALHRPLWRYTDGLRAYIRAGHETLRAPVQPGA
jgi:hypothetical protein